MTNTRPTLTAFVWILLGVTLSVLLMISSYFIPLFMGAILTLLSYPLHRRLRDRGLKNQLSALLVTLLVVFLVVAPLLLFATLAIRQGLTLVEAASQSEALSSGTLSGLVKEWEALGNAVMDTGMGGQIKGAVQSSLKAASMVVLAMARSIPLGLVKLVLAALTCYFLLVDGPRFLRWIYARLPLSFDVRRRLTDSLRNTAVATVWASMTAALAQALIMAAAFLILGVPAAFLAGGLTFVLAFVPFAGSFPVWVGAVIYLFLQGHLGKAGIMLAFGLFTATIDNVIRPWVLKGRNEMHPLISLIAILGGIEAFGLFGVFLGPILAAVFISLLQIWPEIGRRYGVEFDTGFEAPLEIRSSEKPSQAS